MSLNSIRTIVTFQVSTTEGRRDLVESLIACPEAGAGRQGYGRQQVYVDITQASSMNAVAIDECEYLFRFGYRSHWKITQ